MSVLGEGNGPSWPSSVDTRETQVDQPAVGKTLVDANLLNDILKALIAIETELGTDPAGSLTDLKTRLAILLNSDGTIKLVKDSDFSIGDNDDITKKLIFSLGGATAAKVLTLLSSHTNDRILTLPDKTGTLLTSLLEDTSPQLGGFLDPNSKYIGMAKGANLSSANPLVIGTDGDYFNVTGNVNFASMTVVANRLFVLQFNGTPTITHHSTNLDLPGEANIIVVAGDSMICFSTGANTVHVLSYTRAGIIPGSMNLVDDITPQLGGDLDLNSKNIDFPSVPNISDCKDEDNMASDSATMLATQQSIKKYVDDKSKHQSDQAVGTTSSPSTTSTSFVDMPQMSITMTTGANPIMVTFSLTVQNTTDGGATMEIILDIDGTNEISSERDNSMGVINRRSTAGSSILKTMTAASHTIKVQWLTNLGTFVTHEIQRNIQVIELK